MTLESLNSRWSEALAAELGVSKEALVYGEGNRNAPLVLLVGEAPGAQETIQRRPFVGKAGQNLNEFLRVIDLPREGIYITNLVKIRPTKTGASGRLNNRPPTKAEIQAFLPWLMEECDLVKPGVIVTLGNSALKAFMGQEAVIGELHGELSMAPSGWPVFALYHPAAIIYNRSLSETYTQDLQKLTKHVKQMPRI